MGPPASPAGVRPRRLPAAELRAHRDQPGRRLQGAAGRSSGWTRRVPSRSSRSARSCRLALAFVYVRRRVGAWLALAGVLPIFVLGPSWDDLLWPFQIGFFGSMCAGLGALLVLERRDRLGDAVACVLLVVSISFSSLGVPFALGGALAIALGPDRRRRAWVALVPIALLRPLVARLRARCRQLRLAAQPRHRSRLHPRRLRLQPRVAARARDPERLDRIAARLGPGAAGARRRARALADPGRRAGRGAASGSCSRSRSRSGFGRASTPRSSASPPPAAISTWAPIFVVLLAAELLRGVKVNRWAATAAMVVAALAALSNLSSLHTAWRGLTQFGQLQPAGLAALELTRDRVAPDFQLTEQNSGVDYLGLVDAGSYFSAVDAFGSPGLHPGRARRGACPGARGGRQGLRGPRSRSGSRRAPAAAPARRSSSATSPGRFPSGPPGRRSGPRPPSRSPCACAAMRPTAFPVALGSVRAGRTAVVTIPPDGSGQPWQLGLSGSGRARVCEARP